MPVLPFLPNLNPQHAAVKWRRTLSSGAGAKGFSPTTAQAGKAR